MRADRGSVRVRITAVTTGLVALVLLGVAAALVVAPRSALLQRLDGSVRSQADEIVEQIRSARSIDAFAGVPGPTGEEQFAFLVFSPEGRVYVAAGDLVGASVAALDVPALLPPGGRYLTRSVEGEDLRLFVRPFGLRDGRVVYVAAAARLSAVHDAVAEVRRVLLVVVPALVGLVGVASWAVVGRALQPVERIRAEVAAITASALDRRVPEPESDDEVGRLARTMNGMLDRLQRSSDRQRRFVSDASHELRSPLATIRAELEVALAHGDAADWEATARRILAEDLRLQHLVDDLLALARSDEAGASGTAAEVDLDDIVLGDADRARAGSVLVDTSEVSAGRVLGDRQQLVSVVRNLLDNAVGHAASQVSVSVVANPDGWVVLTVDDDGPGIAPEDRDRVFERFARLDDARDRRGGTGLGLALVRAVVSAHGGGVDVAESPMGGARFVVRLPACEPDSGPRQPA